MLSVITLSNIPNVGLNNLDILFTVQTNIINTLPINPNSLTERALIRLYNVFTESTIMKFTIQKIIITKSIITFENLLKTETCKNQIENK